MITMREDKSDKKQMREDRVEQMFDSLEGKELTIDQAVDKYFKIYDDDPKMNYKIMSIILKNKCDNHILSRERRTMKENRSGRVEKVNMIYYRKCEQPIVTKEEVKTEAEPEPELELVPKTIEQKPTEQKSIEQSTQKKKDLFDMMSKLTFAEALEKLYTGHKIVSAVSGNIYTIMNVGGKKGVTSSAEPGVIMSFFPAMEMEGSWRVMDAPRTCPYCDYPVKLNHETIGAGAYYYICTNANCLAHGPRASSPEQAVVKFNKRI